MKNLRPRVKILVIIFLTCSAAISLTYETILRQIGNFLIFGQQPQKADVIVVLNGRDTERALAAADLYANGYANLIVLPCIVKQPGTDEFWKRVGEDFKTKIFFQRAIEALGVQESDFKMIGNGVTSTFDEAKVTREFIMEKGFDSIIVVTSKWHSKRTYYTFKSVFKNDDQITIAIYPTKYDTFNADNWWEKESQAEAVFREYVRLIYYAITLRISPFT
jgi:uncharacterized SAM-binding protein YcdF (DUF218 family)